jgi:hypothetical protein
MREKRNNSWAPKTGLASQGSSFIFLLVLHLGLRFERSQRLRAHQVVEIGANLRGGKQSLDGGDLDSGQAGIILL